MPMITIRLVANFGDHPLGTYIQNVSELVTVPSQGEKIKSSTMLQGVGLGHG